MGHTIVRVRIDTLHRCGYGSAGAVREVRVDVPASNSPAALLQEEKIRQQAKRKAEKRSMRGSQVVKAFLGKSISRLAQSWVMTLPWTTVDKTGGDDVFMFPSLGQHFRDRNEKKKLHKSGDVQHQILHNLHLHNAKRGRDHTNTKGRVDFKVKLHEEQKSSKL